MKVLHISLYNTAFKNVCSQMGESHKHVNKIEIKDSSVK